MRELREFREHHSRFEAAGIELAGVSTDSVGSHREWAARLRIGFPLLSDPEAKSARALGILRRIGFGSWNVELFRRTTLLVGADGVIAAAWGKVRLRGHAAEVLHTAIALKGLD